MAVTINTMEEPVDERDVGPTNQLPSANPSGKKNGQTGKNAFRPKFKNKPVDPTAALTQQARDNRLAGMKEGEVLGDKYFGGGRELQPMVGNLLDQYQQQATQGMGAPAFQAMRNRAMGGLEQQLNTGMRDINAQQGASGVRGAAAMAGKQNLQYQNQQARGDLENQFMVQDVGVRERGMAGLGDMLNGERAGQLGATMGMGNMYAQDLANAQQNILGQQQMTQAKADLDASNKPADKSWLEKQMDVKNWDPSRPGYTIGGGNNPGTNPAAYVYNKGYQSLGPGSYNKG